MRLAGRYQGRVIEVNAAARRARRASVQGTTVVFFRSDAGRRVVGFKVRWLDEIVQSDSGRSAA
jgi:hypothetical protein